nr:hypothetical protein [Thalassobacillus sp. C254]
MLSYVELDKQIKRRDKDMIQRFIELGEGYADIYEWLSLVEANSIV